MIRIKQVQLLAIGLLFVNLDVLSDRNDSNGKEDLFELSLDQLLGVTVTGATKSPLSLKTVPATVVVLTAQDIKQRGYESLEDVMRDLPGIDIVDVQGTFPVIWAPRGAYGDENKRTLLLIDGLVENNILEGNVLGGPQYSLHNVERIEFLWGPASALYGANALSGVINIITRKGRDIDGSEIHLITGVNNTRSVKMLTGRQIDDFEYSLSASVFDTEGPVFKERNPNYTSSYVDNAYSVVGRLSYKDSTFGFHRYDRPMGYGQFSNSANAFFGLPLFGFENSEGQAIDDSLSPVDINGRRGTLWHSITTSAFLDLTQDVGSATFKERIYYRDSEIADDSYAYTLSQGDWAFIPFTHYSRLAGLELQMDYQTELADSFILGVDFEKRNVEKGYRQRFVVQASPRILGIGDDRISTQYYSRSLFSQYRLFTDLFSSTTFTLGARFDDNSVYGSSLNPRVGIVVEPSEKLTVKALMASAFRAPNSFDLFTETTIRIANPDLKPEKSRNFEFSLSYQVSDKIYVESILFFNHLTDMIVSNVALGDIDNDGSVETQNQNVGKAHIHGIELRSRFDLDRTLKLFANVSYQETELNQPLITLQPGQPNDEAIPNTAKLKANFGFSWQLSDRSSTYIAGRFVGDRATAFSNPRDSVAGYFVSDLAFSYQFPQFKALDITLRVNNLFDTKYYDPAVRAANGLNFPTQYEYPGTNAWLKMSLSL